MARHSVKRPIPAGRWLVVVEAAIREVQARGEPEQVHQLRIALARVAVFLRLAGEKRLTREVRWLRRWAAPVRDADVQLGLATSGAAAKRHQRRRLLVSLQKALASARARRVLRALHAVEPLRPGKLERGLRRLARRALKTGAKVRRAQSDPARLHAARRALRKARYAFEIAGLPTGALSRLQDTLGEVQDLAISRAPASKSARARRKARGQWPEVERRLEAVV
jgi:CHAD domain-containing protein